MRWPNSLGLCLLVLTAVGCGAAGRASLPVESGPDQASARGADPGGGSAAPADTAHVLPAADAAALTRIRVAPGRTAAGGVKVEIEASSPVNYTSYQPEPERFILEIPNVNLASLPAQLSMAEAGMEPALISSLPSHHGGTHARIEFTGRGPLEAKVTPEGAILAVYLDQRPAEPALVTSEGPAEPAAAEAATAAATAASEPVADAPSIPAAAQAADTPARTAAARRDDATLVTGIVVEGSGTKASVAIVGDGAFKHNEFTLKNPDRLVVDLIGVVNRVHEKSFAVSADPLERVRVAQFKTQPQKVVRVVFDLTRQIEHRVIADGDGIRVVLGEGASPADVVAPAALKRAVESAALSRPFTALPETPAAAPADTKPSETVSAAPSILEPAPARGGDGPASGGPLADETAAPGSPEPAAASVPPLPEIPSRLVPTSPRDLSKDVVLFDRSDPGQTSKDEMGSSVPGGVTFQSQTIAGEKRRYRGEKISVTFRDADVREVFFFFADVMKMNVVLDPDVAGKIDIRLTQVPWDQAFQVILKNQGLDAVEEESVVRIAKTQKLRSEAAERRALKQAQEQEVDPITFTRKLSYAKVSEALTVMQQVKSERGKIIADNRTNTLIISDIPEKRAAYDNLLNALDSQTPQVSIEARIVEAIRSFERDLGIDWGFVAKADPSLGTQTNLQFPHRADFNADVNLLPKQSNSTLGLALGNVLDSVTLDVQLDAFESEGKVRILSAPKVVTQNNQPATIEQGVQIPVVTTTATQIEVQYVPASLRLIVTPQITAEQTVIMKVLVENNQPSTTVAVAGTPGIVTERVDTQILVRTGTTAVIGGVYKLQETDNESGVPGLHRIPFFGWLFKNKQFKKDSSELIVFLTPKIVTNV